MVGVCILIDRPWQAAHGPAQFALAEVGGLLIWPGAVVNDRTAPAWRPRHQSKKQQLFLNVHKRCDRFGFCRYFVAADWYCTPADMLGDQVKGNLVVVV